MKTRPVGAELFHADRHDEAIVAVCNFADAPKNALKAQKCSLIPPPPSLKCAIQLRKSAICMLTFSSVQFCR